MFTHVTIRTKIISIVSLLLLALLGMGLLAAGTIRSLRAGPLSLLVFVGRVHLYEGHPVPLVVHGMRTAVAAGCRVVVLTNAAGGIREGLQVGQPVLIRDHLNLTGRSPLTGPPPPDSTASTFPSPSRNSPANGIAP